MRHYKSISREDFEKRKDFVEQIMLRLGCEPVDIKLPYEQKTTSYAANFKETWLSKRSVYKFKNGFYRVSEVLFAEKPFIVLEFADTEDEAIKNIMEDLEPFPCDISDEETINEIKYSLGIEPYPHTDKAKNLKG